MPRYGHLPLLAGESGERLSKRDGSLSLASWRDEGLLPAAVTNYLARLGLPWPDAHLMDLEAMAKAFDPHELSTARPRLDSHHLERWQHLALDDLDEEGFVSWAGEALAPVPADRLGAFVATVRHNVARPADVARWADIVFGGDHAVAGCPDAVPPEIFDAMVRAWDEHGPDLKALAADVRQETGAKGKNFFRPLRIALTGLEAGPELGPLLALMPADTVRRRLARCGNA
ncbi:MAG: glutamate--tRNA ligase family protein [Gammaproteobacteria bacterium]